MTSHQPIILALTGGIACGKSEAGRILTQHGFAVLDVDLIAHDIMKAGGPVFKHIVEQFGESVVGIDGEIERVELGRIIFADPEKRKTLNSLTHPAVIEATEQWKSEQSGDAAVMVPLLFEAGWMNGWDAIVCVSADEQMVFQRLEKRGLSHNEARSRIAAQMPLSEKENRSDFIIKNSETLDALRDETLKVLETIRCRGNDHE